jgi:ankyrin repeat protein
MALLCMGYLTFDCFDADQSDDDIRQNIATAKYAFQDYAVAHWIDHLKASVQNTVGPCSHQELTDLVDDFIAKHWNDAFKPNPRIPKQVKTAFRALEGHDFHEHLLQAYHFGNADAPATESTVEPLELLRIVRRVRLVYEQMVSALPARESAQGRQLRQYYGANWFKCPRPVCRRFYDGFASARERDSHEKRHSRSFRCDVAGCFASASGCASEQSLKKHKAEYHSGVESLFPTYRPKTVAEGTNAVAEDKIALLFKLAREGDVRALKQHLDPACVSVTDAKRDTLMHIAGRLGNVDLAQTLLSVVTSGTGEANAAAKLVNARNKNGASPLSLSLVKNGNEAIVKLLLKHGAIPKSHNRRLLSMADRIGDDEFSGLLRQIATDLPPPFPMEDESVTRVIRFMFNDSYRVDFPVDKTQLLFHAAHSDNEQAATICLEHGANVNGTAVRRPLVATARKGHREMVQLLLEAGADPNASEKGETALGVAMFYGSAGVLRTLLEHSEIAVNLSSSMDGPPICCAAIRGVAQAVQLLLEHPKIEVNAQTASGKTALILAAEEGHLNVIQALLKSHHIDIAAVDKDGLTALDWAKRNKRNKVAAEIEAFLAHSSSAATNKGWVNGRW